MAYLEAAHLARSLCPTVFPKDCLMNSGAEQSILGVNGWASLCDRCLDWLAADNGKNWLQREYITL